MLTVSHPSVNQYVRALVGALDRRGQLEAFHTTIAAGRRSVDIPRRKIHQHPYREALRLLSRRCGTNSHHGWISVDAVARGFDRHVAKAMIGKEGVYCYEDSALATFRAAAERGLKRYYELPILYWESVQRLLREEGERYPEWEPTLLATRDSVAKLERKSLEVRLADLVICPSRQVQKSLPPEIPSLVAEYGCPEPIEAPPPPRAGSRLRVLFVGAMSQRKGLADLFAAMKLLNRLDVELVVLGTPLAPLSFYRRSYPSFIFEPTRPNAQVRRLMLSCDVLVLPSIVEGRAMVQMEALSCGLPIIVTANAGAEDLVEDGQTGFLVPIRQPERLAETMNWIAEDRGRIERMRPAVLEQARRAGWDTYAQKVLAAVL